MICSLAMGIEHEPPSVLPFRPKTTEPCATTPLALETSEEGAFGRRIAAYLSPRDSYAVTANTLSSPRLVATSLQCDWGLFGLSDPIPSEKASIVSVQLKELPFHERDCEEQPSRPATILRVA